MGGHGWGGGDGDGRRGGAEEEGEGISASSISLFDVRPAPNSAVRATLSKWLGGHQRKCLGTTPPPVLLRLLTKPYRYSVLYRHSRLTFFPGRERERERGERVFRLSAFPTFPRKEGKRAKGEGGREGGKKGRGKLCRPREKRESKNLGELFFDRVFLRFVINIPPLFLLQRESCSFFFKFFFPPSPKFLALQRDAQVSTSFPRGEKGTVYPFSPPKRGGNVVCEPFLPEKRRRVINDPLYGRLNFVPRACFFFP